MSSEVDNSPVALMIPAYMLPDADVGAFRVRGNCMTGDHIRDGDWVIVAPAIPVADGDIAVVNSDRGGALKHMYRVPGGLRLVPSNPAYAELIIPDDEHPVIVGKVVAVVRNFA